MATIEIEISDTQRHLRINPPEVIELARRVLVEEGHRDASISIALVDQASIHALNRLHLSHDWPTDVISFTLSDPDDPTLAGELIVSAEMAVETAAEVGVDPRDELALYLVHGLLHLCGYDDSTDPDSARMRRREDELLTALGYSNPWGVSRVGSREWGVGSFDIERAGGENSPPSPNCPLPSPGPNPLPTPHSELPTRGTPHSRRDPLEGPSEVGL